MKRLFTTKQFKQLRSFMLLLMALLGSATANAQYQLANSDFETWENVSYSGRTGQEPVNWSSYLDGTGNLKSMYGYIQLEQSTDTPPLSSGNYSAKLTSRKVSFGAAQFVSQGNLTNGCVNMGGTSPSDIKKNYNYINTARADQAMKFTGHPDAVSVWIKFSGTKPGFVEVNLVGDMTDKKFQSPENANTAELVARAKNASIPAKDKWTEYTIPFTYSSESAPAYSLVNIATCETGGDGNEADYMYVDDMKMLYYSELESATYNGSPVSFDENNSATISGNYDESLLGELTSNGKAATIETSFNEETSVLTITVKGENISEEADNYHEYTIHFECKHSYDKKHLAEDPDEGTTCLYSYLCDKCHTPATDRKAIRTAGEPYWFVELEKQDGKWIAPDEDDLRLIDDCALNVPVDFTPVAVRLMRSFDADGWYSLCLPFDVTDISMFAQVAEFSNIEGDTYKFKTVSAIEAGKAYIVRVDSDIDYPMFYGVTLKTGEPATDGAFIGVYSPTELGAGCKVIGSGTTVNPATSGTMRGFRCYFPASEAGAKAMRFTVDGGEATNIELMQNAEFRMQNYYNLAGQKVDENYRGIVIKNGKRYLKK